MPTWSGTGPAGEVLCCIKSLLKKESGSALAGGPDERFHVI
jgi:hypothetical protein